MRACRPECVCVCVDSASFRLVSSHPATLGLSPLALLRSGPLWSGPPGASDPSFSLNEPTKKFFIDGNSLTPEELVCIGYGGCPGIQEGSITQGHAMAEWGNAVQFDQEYIVEVQGERSVHGRPQPRQRCCGAEQGSARTAAAVAASEHAAESAVRNGGCVRVRAPSPLGP